MMSSMTSNLGASVADLGIEIIDFRVKRIDLPSELSSSVLKECVLKEIDSLKS